MPAAQAIRTPGIVRGCWKSSATPFPKKHSFGVVLKLLEKAEAGDTSAAKIIVTYVVGKPLPAPHPDSIDRDEWDHFQKDAMNQKELAIVMNSLPTQVGNDVARDAAHHDRPARDLAKQLLKGCPGVKRTRE